MLTAASISRWFHRGAEEEQSQQTILVVNGLLTKIKALRCFVWVSS